MAAGRSKDALEIALRALSRRELSARELAARLARAGVNEDDAAAAIAYLQEAGYQSDARTATERAHVLASRRLGDAAIAADLFGRGLEPDAVEAALAAVPPEVERAAGLAARLQAGPTLAQTLRRRGFSIDTIEAVVGSAVADE